MYVGVFAWEVYDTPPPLHPDMPKTTYMGCDNRILSTHLLREEGDLMRGWLRLQR